MSLLRLRLRHNPNPNLNPNPNPNPNPNRQALTALKVNRKWKDSTKEAKTLSDKKKNTFIQAALDAKKDADAEAALAAEEARLAAQAAADAKAKAAAAAAVKAEAEQKWKKVTHEAKAVADAKIQAFMQAAADAKAMADAEAAKAAAEARAAQEAQDRAEAQAKAKVEAEARAERLKHDPLNQAYLKAKTEAEAAVEAAEEAEKAAEAQSRVFAEAVVRAESTKQSAYAVAEMAMTMTEEAGKKVNSHAVITEAFIGKEKDKGKYNLRLSDDELDKVGWEVNTPRSTAAMRFAKIKKRELVYHSLGEFENEFEGSVGARDKALMRWEASEARRAVNITSLRKAYQSVVKDAARRHDTPTMVKRVRSRQKYAKKHNQHVGSGMMERQMHDDFVRTVISEQALQTQLKEKQSRNPLKPKGYHEAGPTGPRIGQLNSPEEHMRRRVQRREELQQVEEEETLRAHFRAHLQLTDKEANMRLSMARKSMADDYGEKKKRRNEIIKANKEIRTAEQVGKRAQSVNAQHMEMAAKVEAIKMKRLTDQIERARTRDEIALGNKQAREAQVIENKLQRDP